MAARPSIDRIKEDLVRTDEEALQLRKVQERRDSTNQQFNYLFNRLTNAGVDRVKAEEVAMQFVLDEDRRKAASSENEAARDVFRRKQDLLDVYAERQVQIQKDAARQRQKDAIMGALTRTFFGIGGAIVGGVLMGPLGAVAGASLAGTAGTGIEPIITRPKR